MEYLKRQSYLSDGNPNLIETYTGIRDHVDIVIDLLKRHNKFHNENYYYMIRSTVPETLPERAARIIYLNKTCFNGLYRENRSGQFNVPFGRYVNPRICDESNLRAVSYALRSVHLVAQEFELVADYAKKGDLVYFDPPYLAISLTADFTSYSRWKFDLEEHRRLADLSRFLAQRGVHVIVSNSSSMWTYELYEDFYIYDVYATRLVNSRAWRRGKIPEALITSFPIDRMANSFRPERAGQVFVNSQSTGNRKKMVARQWLRENGYGDIADLIDEIVDEWKSKGKHSRRNWWDILAGDAKGNPRIVAGRKFPILRAAQLRQGVSATENAICRNPNEETPTVRVNRRWSSASARR